MKDYKLLFILGLIVLVFPYLGIPEFFRNLVVSIVGAFIVIYSLYVRAQQKRINGQNEESVFMESKIEEKISEKITEEEKQSPEEDSEGLLSEAHHPSTNDEIKRLENE